MEEIKFVVYYSATSKPHENLVRFANVFESNPPVYAYRILIKSYLLDLFYVLFIAAKQCFKLN